ncbi:MAG TPA: hypothetical protein VFV87_02780 [Pirellulaceae bacterium]|nr:hypothetical protein [Pirellulaceae bacterium]
MYALLAAAAIGLLPLDFVTTDTADVIELNHFYDGDGRPVFDQVIFWQWHEREGAYHVLAWRLWKTPAQSPWRDWLRGGYAMAWFDGERLRVVRATSFTETWTQHDPELDDRQYFPVNLRRGLIGERAGPPAQAPSTQP